MNPAAPSESPSLRGGLSPSQTRTALAVCGYVLLYVLADCLSYVQPVLKLGITPWNPQAGLTLAFLLLFGSRWAVATAVAALLSEVLVRHASSVDSPLVLGASMWIALGYGALASVLRRYDLVSPVRTLLAAARLAGASVVFTLIIAAGYVVLFVAAGDLSINNALQALPRLWIGDVTGILTLTPLLLYSVEWRLGLRTIIANRWEVLAQAAVLLTTLWLCFGLSGSDQLRFFYPLFVPVIWISLRWGLPGAVTASLIVQIALIVAAEDAHLAPPLVRVQFLMLTLSLTALFLGAVATERAAVMKRIAVREAEQRALLATVPDAVIAVTPGSEIQMANPAALSLFGAAAVTGKHAQVQNILPGLHLDDAAGRLTLDGRRSDGSIFPAEIAWAKLDTPSSEGFIVTVRDATERRRSESQLRERDVALARAMRFAVAGELSSALAHELNQPIMALVSYLRACEVLADPVNGDERLRTALGKAAREAIRASEVLRKLRDFYRGGALKRTTIQLGELVTARVDAFQDRLRAANVTVTTHIEQDLPNVEADPTQLEIVIHNLMSNALEALSRSPEDGRRIELSVARDECEIVLRVADSGRGLAPEIAAKLFEPFVTDKPQGMGLGLAISRSLLRAQGGDLSHESTCALGGACFVVRLPNVVEKALV